MNTTQKHFLAASLCIMTLAVLPNTRAQEPAPTPAQTPAAAPASKGKQAYSGPTTVIQQPPTPMLDEEGKQRLDPEGKPMFNPPVLQQRDKLGHPLFDQSGKPVFQTANQLGYDERGKKLYGKREKLGKTMSLDIVQGTLTVDGMIGKAALNYDIKDLKYIYFYTPWIGTVIVSNIPFPGAKEQSRAFDQHTLTVNVENHTLQVYSEKLLLGNMPEPAYVAVDRDFKLASQLPVIGFGTTQKAPYNWPGAKPNPESKALVKAPSVPANLRPMMLLPPCPAGQMRAPSSAATRVESTQAAPCLPIDAAPSTPVLSGAPAPPAASAPLRI